MSGKIGRAIVVAWVMVSVMIILLSIVHSFYFDVDSSVAIGDIINGVIVPFYLALTTAAMIGLWLKNR